METKTKSDEKNVTVETEAQEDTETDWGCSRVWGAYSVAMVTMSTHRRWHVLPEVLTVVAATWSGFKFQLRGVRAIHVRLGVGSPPTLLGFEHSRPHVQEIQSNISNCTQRWSVDILSA